MNSRGTYAEVNTDNFLRNIFEVSKKADTHVVPVLKADAYGHGAVKLAHVCQKNGIGLLVVAFLEEGIEMRESGILLPILELNYFQSQYVKDAIENDITITIFSKTQMDSIASYLNKDDRLKVHMVIDTGMGRLGPSIDEALPLYEKITKDDRFVLEGIYTHFSSADEPSDPLNGIQMDKFKNFISKIKKPKYVHISNSAGATILDNKIGNFCRVGIACYGLQPSSKVKVDYLKPVMSVHSSVAFLKQIENGRTIGYGHTFTAREKMRVATIPFGYADGLPRALSNKGHVLINGKRAKIIGRVSMDQTIVDVSDIENVKIGDDAVIIGKSGTEEITAEEIAEIAGMINYEIVCGISKRVPRIYV